MGPPDILICILKFSHEPEAEVTSNEDPTVYAGLDSAGTTTQSPKYEQESTSKFRKWFIKGPSRLFRNYVSRIYTYNKNSLVVHEFYNSISVCVVIE